MGQLDKYTPSWTNIFCGYDNWVEVISDGILIDTRQNFGEGQRSEYEMRESVAKPFIGEPEQAVREATRHHSYVVMRRKAYKVLESLSFHQRKKTVYW